MSEAICTPPAFHLPGGYQTIRQRAAAEERSDGVDGRHPCFYFFLAGLPSALGVPCIPSGGAGGD